MNREPFIEITIPHETRKTLRFARELPERMKSFQKMLLYILAKEVHDGLLARIPKSPQYGLIRENLEIAEVAGTAGFAVHIKTRGKKIKRMDAKKTVIYVRGKSKKGKIPDDIKLLEEMGPWTVETIPFWPDKRYALIIQRKVRIQEVEKIEKYQKGQKSRVRKELARAGFPPNNKKTDKAGKIPKNIKAVPDAAMLSLSLEFGTGGHRSIPAWRLSITDAISSGIRKAPDRYRALRELLEEPTSRRWKRWPRVKYKIKPSTAKQYKDFMQKTGF